MQDTTELSNEQIYDQAVAHYRAARWSEAIAALGELLERGQSGPEVDALLQDIKLKQRLEAALAPAVMPPPPRRPSRAGLAFRLGGGVTGLAIIGAGLWLALSQPTAPRLAPSSPIVAAVGALPTAAPALPTPAPTAAAVGIGTLNVTQAAGSTAVGASNIYLILDASGSMLARVGDQRKIDLAQKALTGLVEVLPDSSKVALRTYGRQRPDDCTDTELLAPMAPLDRGALRAKIEAVEPVNLSRTPIGRSLAAVPDDLGTLTGETKVVLVSDGEESCDADPVATAAQIRAAHPDLSVSVVGFDIAPELRAVLAQIAEAGGGSYYDTSSVEQLAAALQDVVAPHFSVRDLAGAEVGSGQLGAQIELPAGTYSVIIGAGPNRLDQTVEVREGMATEVTVSVQGEAFSATVNRDWGP